MFPNTASSTSRPARPQAPDKQATTALFISGNNKLLLNPLNANTASEQLEVADEVRSEVCVRSSGDCGMPGTELEQTD